MIRNLNQVNFKGFGTISPERAQSARLADKDGDLQSLALGPGPAPVYLCDKDCWVCCASGMTVLSVSKDNQEFLHFYLDKPVRITQGIYFSLSPFQGSSTAELAISGQLNQVGAREPGESFQVKNLLKAGSLYTFFYQEKEQGFFFPGETHPMLELTYVDQGSLHSVADGADLLLERGDLVLYGPNQWHMQYADIGVAPRFVTISFDLEGGNLSSLFNKKFQGSQQVVSLLQQMLREQERMDPYSGDMIMSQLSMLLLTLQRQEGAPAPKLKASNALHSENEIIRRAQQYISSHIREKLSVPLVARMVDVSPSYLTALFHKNLQISPGEYIRRIKLQESKQMIREDNMNFTEIAAALQYSTVHHFSRQFKDKFGITPTEYAKSVR